MRTLFKIFFQIGLFTFGGGYAMIPLIEHRVVDQQQWLSRDTFLNIIAMAQSCPGVFAINMGILVGWHVSGVRGAIAAVAGVSLPSFVIILLIASFFQQFRHLPAVEHILLGLRPAVVALMAAPALRMGFSGKLTVRTMWIPILGALAIWLYGLSPIIVIILAAAGGWIVGKMRDN